MLALVTIFLFTLLLATVAVWIYRSISGWHGFKQTVVGHSKTTVRMKLRAQQGYISLISPKRNEVKKIRLRTPKGGIKAPWGW